jgi:HSP90 family molecular chaperone
MELLFQVALVAEGSELADPVQLNQRVLALMQRTL